MTIYTGSVLGPEPSHVDEALALSVFLAAQARITEAVAALVRAEVLS